MDSNGTWTAYFTPREMSEIRFAQTYAMTFDHGTDGHNAKIIIAKMATLLNANEIKDHPNFLRVADARGGPQIKE